MSIPVLEFEAVDAGYAGVPVLRSVTLSVRRGEVVALLGANGAGKTTTLRAVSGLVACSQGTIRVGGMDVTTMPPDARARLGLAHVPQGRGLFPGLTVREHFRLGHRHERLDEEVAYECLPVLRDVRDRRAGLLSGGEQQMLAVGRALARRPRVLLLDELTLGLAPLVTEGLLPVVRRLATEAGCGVLLVEQQVRLGLEFADRGYVMARGEIVLQGQAADLRADHDRLIATYLPRDGGGDTGLGRAKLRP